MRRKTIMLAGKTLVISLPSTWVRKWGVKKGQELEIKATGRMLNVEVLTENEVRKAVVKGGMNKRVLKWTLSCLHKKGYDAIEIIDYDKEQAEIVKEVVRDLFIGFTITEQTEKRILIEAISKAEENTFKQVLRRAFLVTLELAERLKERLEHNEKIEDLTYLEKMNNQLTNHCERLLNKFDIDKENKTFYYVIIWNLEKVADDYKYLIQNEPTKEILNELNKVNQLLRNYYELFYKFDIMKLNEHAENCKILKKKLFEKLENNPKICHLYNIVQKISDFYASTIAINSSTNK